MIHHSQDHLLVPRQTRLYSRNTLLQLLNHEQQELLQAVDGVRNVREIALLLGSTDEQLLFELRQLATLEIIKWLPHTTQTLPPSTEENIPSMRHARTPLPLRSTHSKNTQHAQRTISSTPSAFQATQDTHEQHRIPTFATEDSTPSMRLPRPTQAPISGADSFIKNPGLKLMDWEDVCIPEQSNQPGRPQHQLPPPSSMTPLPLYRPSKPRNSGPFTPIATSPGIKPTIKKK